MKLELQEVTLEKVEIPDLRRLKELSVRLHLSPKRESVIQWHSDLEKLQSEGIYPVVSKTKTNDVASVCSRKQNASETSSSKIAESEKQPYSIFFDKVQIENQSDDADKQPVCMKKLPSSAKNDACKHGNAAWSPRVYLRNPKREPASGRKQTAKFFTQRSSEDCQEKIRHYALRLESTSPPTDNQLLTKQRSNHERLKLIAQALERVRTDLLDMRIQDNALARQLLDGRDALVQVRAEKTCEEHAQLLEDFSWELELEEELTEKLRSFDLPSAFLRPPDSLLRSSSPLRLIGISRMTMESQRFSVI